MRAPDIPVDEADRLQELLDLNLLDTEPEERFDHLTRLATHLFGVPMAMVSLVDADRQWFKSKVGLTATETPRDVSFCGHAINGDDAFVVADPAHDERFADNPLVTGDPRIGFYAGQPLHGPRGHRVGTLCVLDNRPRSFTEADEQALRDLGAIVEHELAAAELADTMTRLQRTEARYEASFAQAPIGMALIGLTGERLGTILEINEALVELTGYPREDAVGRPTSDFIHADDLGVIVEGAAAASRGEIERLDREVRLIKADDSIIWARVRSRRVDDESGERYGIVHIVDVTDRRRYEDELAHLALHDPLTGLANRRLLTERLSYALAHSGRGAGPVAVIYIDLDHFKQVNDTWGHEAGDTLIVAAADRLSATVREIDTAARFGGDEFVLVCPALADIDAALAVADRVQLAFTEPIDLGVAKVTLSLSGGIAMSHDPKADPAKLLSAADEALYRAKQSGRNRFEVAPEPAG